MGGVIGRCCYADRLLPSQRHCGDTCDQGLRACGVHDRRRTLALLFFRAGRAGALEGTLRHRPRITYIKLFGGWVRKTPYRAFAHAVSTTIPYVFTTRRSGGNRHGLLVTASARSPRRRTFHVTVARLTSNTHIIRYGAL